MTRLELVCWSCDDGNVVPGAPQGTLFAPLVSESQLSWTWGHPRDSKPAGHHYMLCPLIYLLCKASVSRLESVLKSNLLLGCGIDHLFSAGTSRERAARGDAREPGWEQKPLDTYGLSGFQQLKQKSTNHCNELPGGQRSTV